ncbi:DUF6671 family protein [Actinoplanes sp. CA-030573]|uniref:DUF6671 family protein n=1 Tax=Actinoplanes sp. CA-030573 TaxID=3239898 RepID=UPI003D90C2D6
MHEELLRFRDTGRGIEIIEGERVPIALPQPVRVATIDEAAPFLERAGFGEQAVIVRPPTGENVCHIHKGITDAATLTAAIHQAAQRSTDGMALREPDLRAPHNPPAVTCHAAPASA